MPPRYKIIYAVETLTHLDFIQRKFYSLIRTSIAEQLSYTPDEPTRNRKFLRKPAPFGASWELRFGAGNRFRVFYDVTGDTVLVLAIGQKVGNRLFVGGEEYSR